MSTDLNNLLIYVAAFIFIIALIALAAWMLKGLTGGRGGGGMSFLRGRDRRLGVIEAANMDARRKLVLIKRDDVEHLIMIGGPIDIVVETGIQLRRDSGPSEPGVTNITPDSARDRITLESEDRSGLSPLQTQDRYDKS